jgi:ribosomal protein L11
MYYKVRKSKDILKKILFLKLKSMSATSGPPIGPVLGQCGIPAGPFCKDFNERSEIFNADVLLFVTIKLMVNNEYIFDIELPNMSFFFKRAVYLSKGRIKPGYIFDSDTKFSKYKRTSYKAITPYILYEILLYKYIKYGYDYMSINTVRKNLGTLKSIGLFVGTES